jgi:hypothetical protein
LAGYGISKSQRSRWQKLDAVPEGEFRATFAYPRDQASVKVVGPAGINNLRAAVENYARTTVGAEFLVDRVDRWANP